MNYYNIQKIEEKKKNKLFEKLQGFIKYINLHKTREGKRSIERILKELPKFTLSQEEIQELVKVEQIISTF